MLSGTIRVFHESKNATLALRGCTHFENIRRRESHFSQKHPQKTGISTMINGVFLKMNAQWHHYGVPRVQKRYSCLTRLHPLREHSPTEITLFPKKSPSINRHFHHDKQCILENECSVAPLGCSTSPKTPLLPYEVAPTSRTFADGNHTLRKKKHPQKINIFIMINGIFWKMNAQWHH